MNAPVRMPRKPFAWSPSALKDFETCAKRYYHTRLIKDFREAESDQLIWGNRFHEAIARAIDPAIDAPLPEGMETYAGWVPALRAKGRVIVEQQRALNREMQPTGWFDKDAWLRCVIDVLIINETAGSAFVIDWKTGKPSNADDTQLLLSALTTFAYHPEVNAVRTGFVFVGHGNQFTNIEIRREAVPDIWSAILPRVRKMNDAYEKAAYPANPGYLCARWCPVASCQHHGKK